MRINKSFKIFQSTEFKLNKLHLDKINYGQDGLQIYLSDDENKTIKILFNCIGYQVYDESYRYFILEEIVDYVKGETIYISYDSKYLNDFFKENYNRFDKNELIHFLILTQDTIIDVLTLENPKILLV